ncbi:MAG: chromate efflux transporter [Chloroflexi bacterium]|nr:chromate efflux transporter [Chloroflexota bacterium]
MTDTSLSTPVEHPAPTRTWRSYAEVAAVFLKIGATAFGGPAAHVAIMRDELVDRRKWVTDQHFLDLLGATNLIPGPNSSEMTMHLGFVRAGLIGLIVGGTAFLLPAMLIVIGLAWAYTEYGTTPAAEWLLYGIKPVIIPLIVLALWALGQRAVKGRLTGAVGIAAMGLYFLGVNFVILLLAGGVVVMLVQNRDRLRNIPRRFGIIPLPLLGSGLGSGLAAAGSSAASFSLWKMFWALFKIGALMYGSGYVLFAFLQADLVDRFGWLTEQELIDAIAIGQMTPGPLSTSATFIGYLLDGVPGAILATLGIYLPAFIVVAISNPLIPRIRQSVWAGSMLDGVNVAALGLMAAVTWELARAAVIDWYTLVVGLAAAVWLFRYKPNSVWLVAFGALAGLISSAW